jgi:transposase InsO family protein
VSKQAVQQARKRQHAFDQELAELLILVDDLRQGHPGCGVEKMYYTLRPKTMGRDQFCKLFIELGYGVKRVRNYQRTTYSGSHVYANLIEGMAIYKPFQVIQSDITYFYLNGEFYYLVFIIDVYTRIIVGYSVNNTLRTQGNIKAMNMALNTMEYHPWELIHHSDRGSQYGSNEYTNLLKRKHIHISMGKVAWENPFAERINGIIKNEYLKLWIIKDFKDLTKKVTKAVTHYNTQRLHRAFKMNYTPLEFYQKMVNLKVKEKPTVIVYAEGRNNFLRTSNPAERYQIHQHMGHACPVEINDKC